MLLMVLRRMSSSRWMIICLLIGSILATALVSSIPIYTNGILQRMLTKDLENYQLDMETFPGAYQIGAKLYYDYENQDRSKVYQYFNRFITDQYIKEFDLPIITKVQDVRLGNLRIPPLPEDGKNAATRYVQFGAVSDLEKHIKITNGSMYSNDMRDGAYEAVVSQQALKKLNLLLGKEYTLTDPSKTDSPVCKVRVVGVYDMKDPGDPYWYKGLSNYSLMLAMDFGLFNKEFVQHNTQFLTDANWYCAFDYHKITLQNISGIIQKYESQNKWFAKYKSSIDLNMPAIKILEKYNERAGQLKTLLWVLAVPVLIMLTFYIFMVSQLLVNHDENGIAVLKSRGASRLQIFLSYLIESLMIGITALIFGPPLGLLICKGLGSSNGFLEFVRRTALPLKFNIDAYGYALAGVVFLVVTMLIPVIISSRMTIVNYKQGKAGNSKSPLWKKLFLDIVVLAASAYGFYRYTQQQKVLSVTGVKASDLQIDPLLFLTSTMFVLGAGLLFLRIYPYFIRFVYWLGRKIWSPVMYISLIQVGRSRGKEQFLMLFIILAISTGIFNANSARTINKNIEDRIKYGTGADVTITAVWQDNQPEIAGAPASYVAETLLKKPPLRYIEPDYRAFSTLSGTEAATKVFLNNDGGILANGQQYSNIKVMGILPNEFAKIAWFRTDLLPHHWFDYINLMSGAPKAFLLSSNLKERYKIKEGDNIYVSWGEQNSLEGTVYAFVDYWPAYNPNPQEKGKDAPGLVVANLDYMQNKLTVQPYQVWIKKKPDATDKQINDDILKRKLNISDIKYTNQQLIKAKNDPMLQGTNGSLTLGFTAAMVISMLGFLIYWIISIQTRVLQFGILRAMGLSLARVIGMLACEQVLVSGAAILAGIVIGGFAGDTYIPLLQIVYSSADQVPPFKVVAAGGDYIKIYSVIAFMLLIGFITLWRLISRIKIDQAVKLGED